VATSTADSDSAAVRKAAEAFIETFNNLEWERFRRSFSDDVTVFFPFSQVPRRASGRAEVEGVFKLFFDDLRKRRPGPPFQNIVPQEMTVQMLGSVAVVTFHLGGGDSASQRTLVFTEAEGRVAHHPPARVERGEAEVRYG
jgi:ketosteroid isomerase-like protein